MSCNYCIGEESQSKNNTLFCVQCIGEDSQSLKKIIPFFTALERIVKTIACLVQKFLPQVLLQPSHIYGWPCHYLQECSASGQNGYIKYENSTESYGKLACKNMALAQQMRNIWEGNRKSFHPPNQLDNGLETIHKTLQQYKSRYQFRMHTLQFQNTSYMQACSSKFMLLSWFQIRLSLKNQTKI